MLRSLNLILLLFCALLVYFSFSGFQALTRLQTLVNQLNDTPHDQLISTHNSSPPQYLSEFEQLHEKLAWDADVSSMLLQVINNLIDLTANKGQQHLLQSKALGYYKHSLSFRPRDVELLSGRLDLLIDQGAPVEYVLPRLDKIIALVPKDQDLKAELAMLCFKLLALNPQIATQKQVITRLQSLFDYSMDYRGLILVRRYAVLYGQENVLKKILSNQS